MVFGRTIAFVPLFKDHPRKGIGMRKDMAKIIVERERLGGKNDRKGRKAKSWEDMPKIQSMKRAHKDRKSLNENLSPLKRYLESCVGKPWNIVFSDICKNLKVTSAIQKHVRDHVFDFVRLDVEKVGKKIFFRPKYFGKPRELHYNDMYVDSSSGILKRYKRKSPRISKLR